VTDMQQKDKLTTYLVRYVETRDGSSEIRIDGLGKRTCISQSA
jgi:hypothetical protein